MSSPEFISDPFVPELKVDQSTEVQAVKVIDPKDQADLITKVYSELGLFAAELAEQAPELIIPDMETLASDHANKQLEPFVVVNLTAYFGLRGLISVFNRKQGRKSKTWAFSSLWYQYDLNNLNRRRTDGQNDQEPLPGTVRGHVLSAPESEHNEVGLQHTNKNTTEQRQATKGQTLLNITDYILIQAMRREKGQSQLDVPTFTKFPQLDKKLAVGYSCVGGADWREDLLSLGGSGDFAYPSGGLRLSVGLEQV